MKILDWKWLITLLLLVLILLRQNPPQEETPEQTQTQFAASTGSVVLPVTPALPEGPRVVPCQ